MIAWIAAGLAALAGLHIFLPWGVKLALRRRFLAKAARSGCVCLTFDDGPDPACTPELIKILEKHGAKASFFVVGREAERHPEVMRQLAAAGHDIGSHSYAHLFAWTTDPVRTFLDLQRGNRIACEFNPAGAVEFFRPPYGKLNLASLLFMATGGRTIWWNVDPRDYETNSSGAIASHVIERMKPGSVILLHDGGNRALESKQATVDAVDAILTAASGRGLRIATVREVFG